VVLLQQSPCRRLLHLESSALLPGLTVVVGGLGGERCHHLVRKWACVPRMPPPQKFFGHRGHCPGSEMGWGFPPPGGLLLWTVLWQIPQCQSVSTMRGPSPVFTRRPAGLLGGGPCSFGPVWPRPRVSLSLREAWLQVLPGPQADPLDVTEKFLGSILFYKTHLGKGHRTWTRACVFQ
jgi:hypothetical protein